MLSDNLQCRPAAGALSSWLAKCRGVGALLCGCAIVSGCAQMPLGISSDDWQRMSLDERMEARLKQADRDISSAHGATAEAERSEVRAKAAEEDVLLEIMALEERLRR